MLEDHADAPAQGQQPGAVEPDHLDAIHQDAAGLRPLQPVDAADEGALAGAAAADDAQHLARANFERDVVEGGEDRKSVVEGKSVSVRVDLGGRRIITKNTTTHTHNHNMSTRSTIRTTQ